MKTDYLTDSKFVKKENGEMDVISGKFEIRKDIFTFTEDTSYVADRTEIRWGDNILNRQTLEWVTSKESSLKWQCDVFSNDDDYWKQLENIRKQKQKAADELTKDNKI